LKSSDPLFTASGREWVQFDCAFM